MAFDRLTRREVIAAAPLVLLAPGLVRAQPADASVWRFLAIGDWGRDGNLGQKETAAGLAEVWDDTAPDFIVGTGDNFYHWGVWSVNDHRWKTCFEDIYPARLKPWYPVLGNHDYGGSVQAQLDRAARDDRWRMEGRCWDRVFTHPRRPPLHLFFFDTVGWIGREYFPFTLYGAGIDAATQAEQRATMERALDRSPEDAIRIAVGHHGIYSVGPHGGRKELEPLDALLRRHKVAAWVHGHDHCLFHVENDGMHYVCSGAGSEVLPKERIGPDGCALLAGCNGNEQPRMRSFFRRSSDPAKNIDGGFALFEVGARSGRFDFYGRRGTQVGKLEGGGAEIYRR